MHQRDRCMIRLEIRDKAMLLGTIREDSIQKISSGSSREDSGENLEVLMISSKIFLEEASTLMLLRGLTSSRV